MCIFLIGFMGAGKTYWGRIWAQKYKYNFIDLDELIEKQTGKSIAQIFEEAGEKHFRILEKTTLETLFDNEKTIIACGGGTACYLKNLEWMNSHGKTIYLKASAEQILYRVSGELLKRPLLKNLNESEIKSFIKAKLQEREKFYQQANIIIPIEDLKENSLETLFNAN